MDNLILKSDKEFELFYAELNKKITKNQTSILIDFGKNKVDFKEIDELFHAISYKLMFTIYPLEYIQDRIKQDKNKIVEFFNGVPLDNKLIANIEFYVFEMKSCLDVVSQLIRITYGLDINKKYMNINTALDKLQEKNDVFSKYFKEQKDWIKSFCVYRNYITHHMILEPNSSLKMSIGQPVIFNPYILPDDPFSNNKLKHDENRSLPSYFEDVFDKVDTLIAEFIKELRNRL